MKVKLINEPITSDYGKNLLLARGIEDVDKFLAPDSSCLQDWRDLRNIRAGISLVAHLQDGDKVGLVIDCDVDGFTSSAIIYQYLTRLFPQLQFTFYIHDGKAHGLEEHWEQIQDEDFKLVIIPDAGSNDSQYAEKIRCPILVIDHHLVEEENFAPNMTVINNQLSPLYKNKNLSGAGMVYQFCRGLDDHFGANYAKDYIDLAALGICADMMSGLEIENQYFWKEGFSQAGLKNTFFMALALKQSYSITGKTTASWGEITEALNPTSVAFYIVPLINAMIRVGTTEEKERLWLAFIDGHRMVESHKRGAKGTLEEVAIESVRECVNARTHQNKYKEDAVSRLEQKIFKHDLLENKILFVRLDEDDVFPSELTGLIAMQLSQRYKRPTIVARLNDEGFVRGSIRGLSNSELKSFKDYLDSTGLCEYVQGHDNAAGISINNKYLSLLHEKANHDLAAYDFGEDYYEVNFERQALDKDLIALIEDLASYKDVWSQRNDEALIYVKDLHFSKSDVQIMGKNSNTWKIIKNGVTYIKFFANDLIDQCKDIKEDNIKVELVGKANLNIWNNTSTPQIIIEQIEVLPDKILDF